MVSTPFTVPPAMCSDGLIQTGDVLENKANLDLHSITGTRQQKQNIPIAGPLDP